MGPKVKVTVRTEAPRIAVRPTSKITIGAPRKVAAPDEPTTAAPKEGLLEKLQRAEARLKEIADTNPNAKWKLARMRAQQVMHDSNDSEYWIAIAFESRAQKERFLHLLGLLRADEDKYYSGREVAKILGIDLTPDGRAYHTLPVNRRWARFAMTSDGPIQRAQDTEGVLPSKRTASPLRKQR